MPAFRVSVASPQLSPRDAWGFFLSPCAMREQRDGGRRRPADLVICLCPAARGQDWKRPMTSLLIAVGTLFLAVVASVTLDPWPSRTDAAAEHAPPMDAITL